MADTADPTLNPYKMQHPKKRAFLAAYANSGNIRISAMAAGVHRLTYYQWCEHDERFKVACEQAKAEYGDLLEDELKQQIFAQHNTTALIVALKMAGRFVDTQRQEHSGPGGGPQEHRHEQRYTDEQIVDIVSRRAERGRPTGETA